MFYRPRDSVAADVIPFYRDGAFWLFYLRDYRNWEVHGEGTPWELLVTKDFVHFEERGEVISRGTKDEQDLYVFTGSVFEQDGVNYIFYTGHNPYYIAEGRPQEAVMLAKSTDGVTWKKQKDFLLEVPGRYEQHDFRDPFVFRIEEEGCYGMLIAARERNGADRRRGVTLLAKSEDLLRWEVQEKPFYAPEMYYAHECPDLFRIGEWWYLVFSEFSDKCETHYRMAKSWNGPWLTPEYDTFDNRNFYAAKTVSDGTRRYVIGWNPTNAEDRDFEGTQWGGNIVVHELVQQTDGQLFVRLPESVKRQYIKPIELPSQQVYSGVSEVLEDGWLIGHANGYSSMSLGPLSDQCRISFDMTAEPGLSHAYMLLHADESQEASYYVGFDVLAGRMTFDRWPRRRSDYPFMLELERRIQITPGQTCHVDCIVDGPVLEVYFDGQYAMSARMNDLKGGDFGFAASYGQVKIGGLEYLAL